ncbi:RNA polymerase sigma factor [Pedobacter frigidisoli]|uniref:RNA polymerase sigma factor n=1 Tax=Pedobacter frigidisoli TaxID=2530455 RepID=UPI00292E7016|nr:sigma-70 family RNA polymerase sigma factor [Pedobacter frigidisoli]
MIKTLILPTVEFSDVLESPEQNLIKGLVGRHAWAYKKLYQLYSTNLLGITVQIVGHQENAEDVLQESFSKIFRNIDRFDPKKATLFTWMLNVCRNTAIDHLRKSSTRNAHRTFELEANLSEIETHLTHSISTDCIGLKSIIDTLPEKQRRIVSLVYFQGYSQVEAAEELHLPLGSLKTSLRSAVISLRKLFNETNRKKSA